MLSGGGRRRGWRGSAHAFHFNVNDDWIAIIMSSVSNPNVDGMSGYKSIVNALENKSRISRVHGDCSRCRRKLSYDAVDVVHPCARVGTDQWE